MMLERLYTASAFLTPEITSQNQEDGYPDMTSFKSFMIALAGHVATEAAKL